MSNMVANQERPAWGRAAAVIGVSVLAFAYGCGSVPATGVQVQATASDQPGAPVVVSCEPNQRTVVRTAVTNGVAMSQVECVSVAPAVASSQYAPTVAAQAVPVAYRDAAPRLVPASVSDDARVIQPPTTRARPVQARQMIDDDRPPVHVQPRGRSVKKSAIIIGSSAGAGAGVGAAIGGKKGALIGAVIGGGGAALWDQVTRRK